MSFTPFLCSCEIVLCNLFGKIQPSIILPRQGDGQMTYQVLPIWNISHVMTNFTVLLISHSQNAGTRHLHGNCSCHRLLLLQLSLSLSSSLPTLSCHAWISFSTVCWSSCCGCMLKYDLYCWANIFFYFLSFLSWKGFLFASAIICCKSWSKAMITFILKHTDNINERMLSHLHN